MSVLELLPNINVVKSTKLDSRSILLEKTVKVTPKKRRKMTPKS